MKSERGALVRGSDPPSGHSSVDTAAADMWRASARHVTQKHLAAGVQTDGKNYRSLSDSKKWYQVQQHLQQLLTSTHRTDHYLRDVGLGSGYV